MASVFLRRATLSDLAGIEACVLAAYAAPRRDLPDIPDVTKGLAQDMTVNIVWVAEHELEIVGVVVLMRHDDHLLVANLAVHPSCGGRGVGGALMRQAEALATEAGLRRIRLRTHVGLSATRAMYRHLGYAETEVSGNTVSMQKTL